MLQSYSNESLNRIYDLLFCDEPEFFRPAKGDQLAHPLEVLFAKDANEESLLELLNDESLESRVRILAGRILVTKGSQVPQKLLLGVVIEVGLEGGLDVLAAYLDGTARYINHSEKIVIWDTNTEQSGELISRLFAESRKVVQQIGPWKENRLSPPAEGMVRLSFLASDGLYFGQGPFEVLAADAMGGPVINAATRLMQFLTTQN